ncbi:MAG TPA: hypothetical protein VES64_07665 [Allosphingosinicella sp.]|nr:hypothetical protein [Allosphingosinicella sp.]
MTQRFCSRRQFLLGAAVSPVVLAGVGVSSTARAEQTVQTIADLARVTPSEGSTVDLLGYYEPGDGGGGQFRWEGGSTAPLIQGMVVQSPRGAGRWIRVDQVEVNDRMAGAKVDGVTYDDAAYAALAAYVAAYPCRIIRFQTGQRRVLPPGHDHTPFRVQDVDNLTLVFPDCEFLIGEDQTVGTSACFEFNSCRHVKTIGTPKFTGNLTNAWLTSHGTYTGTWGMQFLDDCSFADVSVHGQGIGGTINFDRFPRITVDDSMGAIIAAQGSGYRVGDRITLPTIGVAATIGAAWTVRSVNGGGAITGLTLVDRGLFPHDRTRTGLNMADVGFAVVGGSGSGAKILPYMADYDAVHLQNKSRSVRCRARAVTCYYGLHWIYGVDDSEFSIDADFVYRAFTCYGGNWRNRGTIRQRNTVGDSFAGGSALGLGYDMTVTLIQLPTTSTTFWHEGSQCRISFASGMPAKCSLDLTLVVDVDDSANHFGSLFEVDKQALDGSDVTYPRGHVGNFRIAGRVRGKGRGDSGLGANVIIGTNFNVPGTAWAGERLSWQFRDGFESRGGGGIAIDANSIERLQIGRIAMDGVFTVDPHANGARLPLGAAVTIDPGANIRRAAILASGAQP